MAVLLGWAQLSDMKFKSVYPPTQVLDAFTAMQSAVYLPPHDIRNKTYRLVIDERIRECILK